MLLGASDGGEDGFADCVGRTETEGVLRGAELGPVEGVFEIDGSREGIKELEGIRDMDGKGDTAMEGSREGRFSSARTS